MAATVSDFEFALLSYTLLDSSNQMLFWLLICTASFDFANQDELSDADSFTSSSDDSDSDDELDDEDYDDDGDKKPAAKRSGKKKTTTTTNTRESEKDAEKKMLH